MRSAVACISERGLLKKNYCKCDSYGIVNRHWLGSGDGETYYLCVTEDGEDVRSLNSMRFVTRIHLRIP